MHGCECGFHRTLVGIFLIGFALIPELVGATEPASLSYQELVAVKNQIEDHWFSYDKTATQNLLDQVLKQIEKDPVDWHPHYYAGLVNIKLGNIWRADDKDAAYTNYTAALAHLQIAYDRFPGVENTIVLADAYGNWPR